MPHVDNCAMSIDRRVSPAIINRGAVMMRLILIGALGVALTACNFIEQDKCLDRGGKWDAYKRECIYSEDKSQDMRD